jgi:hypothetical protein
MHYGASMAKTPREVLTPEALRKAALSPEQIEALRKAALQPEQIAALRKAARAELVHREQAAREAAELAEARRKMSHLLAVRDGLARPPWQRETLPRPEPKILEPPGPKPGEPSPKRKIWEHALAILEDDDMRPPRRRGRLGTIAALVRNRGGYPHAPATIAKYIRHDFREWETKNHNK